MKIYLLRHGITPASADKQTKKLFKNVPLSEEGRRQIIQICPFIRSNISKIYTSPAIRTLETAQIVQSHAFPEAEIVIEVRLKNKIDDETSHSYLDNIVQFLGDLRVNHQDSDLLLVTHGRIIKMIYSIIQYNSIDKEIMDCLDIDYGDLFVLYLEEDIFSFPIFAKIS